MTLAPDLVLAERLFDALRIGTGGTQGICRPSYGEGEAFAHALVRQEAAALGLMVATDAAMNLYVTLAGREPGPAILIGSHLDSVPRGGNFDGAAGVLMGLAILSGFKQAGVVPRRDLIVMAIRAEESTWFNASYIGSRAAFGLLGASELESVIRSDDRQSLGHHIAEAGGDVAALRQGEAYLSRERIAVFIEPHIEQGPDLVARNRPAGIVTGIRGSLRYRSARCLGSYAHSGATPRHLRQDAVSAVSRLVVDLNALWHDLESKGEDLAVTFGQIMTDPAEHAFSKVAGQVDFALDMRSQSRATLDRVHAELMDLAQAIEQRQGVRFEWGALTGSDAAIMDGRVVQALSQAAQKQGLDAPLMPCGAGHDAVIFANAGIPTGMLFIRNRHGSHNPLEAMDMTDFAAAAGILLDFCLDWRGTTT